MADNIDYQDIIIQRIKKLREANGISQAKLSEILGISRGQVSNIENPHYSHKYTIKQIDALCKAFDYPVEKVFLPDMEVSPESSRLIDEFIKCIIIYLQ